MNLKKRLYDDFFRPCLINEYEKIIKRAKEHNYEFHTLRSFMSLEGNLDPQKKYIIIRRDVDTADNKIQQMMLEVEKKYNAKCSSYFRNSTMNMNLMRSIELAGGEATYHYEEIASWCYKRHVTSKEEVLANLDLIRDLLIDNVKTIRKSTGLPILTISAHGDYVNKKLNIDNSILIDKKTYKILGIICDAYDDRYKQLLTCRVHDHNDPHFVIHALEVIEREEYVLELLTHPRQWNSPILLNAKEEIGRVIKGLYMRL